jgi:limonene-1,2-epoxide hydrolase
MAASVEAKAAANNGGVAKRNENQRNGVSEINGSEMASTIMAWQSNNMINGNISMARIAAWQNGKHQASGAREISA